jgi:hypothetical protein
VTYLAKVAVKRRLPQPEGIRHRNSEREYLVTASSVGITVKGRSLVEVSPRAMLMLTQAMHASRYPLMCVSICGRGRVDRFDKIYRIVLEAGRIPRRLRQSP